MLLYGDYDLVQKCSLGILVLLCFCNFFNYTDRGILSGILPILNNEFNVEKAYDGILGGSFICSYTIFSILFAILSDRYNCFLILGIGMSIWCISALLDGISDSYYMILVGRILSGTAESSLQAIGPTMIQDLFKDSTTMALSVYFICMSLGQALGNSLPGFTNNNWRWLFRFEFIIMVLITFIIWYIYHKLVETKKFKENRQLLECISFGYSYPDKFIENNTKENIKNLLTNKLWWFITISYSTFVFSAGAIIFWLTEFLFEIYNEPLENIDIAVGIIYTISSIIGNLLGSIILKYYTKFDHKNSIRNIRISSIICIIGIVIGCIGVCLTFWFSNTFLTFKQFIFCFSISLIFLYLTMTPINFMLLECVGKDERQLSISLSIVIIHIFGDMLSPILSGLLWDKTNNPIQTMVLLSLYPIIGLVILFLILLIGIRNLYPQKYLINHQIQTPFIINNYN